MSLTDMARKNAERLLRAISPTPTIDRMEREIHDSIDRMIEQEPLVRRAFEIADVAMFELIIGHSVRGVGDGTYGLADDDSREVRTLAEACDALQEAVEWLAPRGYVRIDSDEHGEHIVVLRRPE